MWDIKCQFQFKARHITINAKNTKSDVNVSEMLKILFTFTADFNLGAKTFKVRLNPGKRPIT